MSGSVNIYLNGCVSLLAPACALLCGGCVSVSVYV